MGDAGDPDPVAVLQSIVGLSFEACVAMLTRSNGDVEHAVNRHFAMSDPRGDRVLSQPSSSSPNAKRRSIGSTVEPSTKKGRRASDKVQSPSTQRSLKTFLGGGDVGGGPASSSGVDTGTGTGPQNVDTCPANFSSQPSDVATAPLPAGATRDPPSRPTMALHVVNVKTGYSKGAPRRPPEDTGADTVGTTVMKKSKEATSGFPNECASRGGVGAAARVNTPTTATLDNIWPETLRNIPYKYLAHVFETLSSTKKRLEKHATLKAMFLQILKRAPTDLLATVYLVFGKCFPSYLVNSELNVGGTAVCAAISEVTGTSRQKISSLHDELGDLGDVAMKCQKGFATLVKPKPLTVVSVLQTLRSMTKQSGKGSTSRRKDLMICMLRACSPVETKYLTRTLVRNLRVGANRVAVLAALAEAAEEFHALSKEVTNPEGTNPEGETLKGKGETMRTLNTNPKAIMASMQRAYALCPSLETLLPPLIQNGVAGVVEFGRLTPGTPCKPMLASITGGVEDAVMKACVRDTGVEKGVTSSIKCVTSNTITFLAEYKYDGVRAQIHCAPPGDQKKNRSDVENWSVFVFSRNCEDRTEVFPDVVTSFRDVLKDAYWLADPNCDGVVIDAEIVGIDRETGKLLPFQDLASRPKVWSSSSSKNLTSGTNNVTQVCVFMFDLLYVGGTTTHAYDLSLRERRNLMSTALPGLGKFPGIFELAKSEEVTGVLNGSVTENGHTIGLVEQITLHAVDAACEGIMLKKLDGNQSLYSPSVRAESWLKLKRDYCETLGSTTRDSLDLVPIGAWFGNGRKAGWFSPFLLAVYDPETESYQSMCRCMSGFTDVFYEQKTEQYKSIRDDTNDQRKPTKPSYYGTLETPDVWFTPQEVWEIRGADLTLSPKHLAAAGMRHESRGISLRFPRFIQQRNDKNVADASTPTEVLKLFDAQTTRWGGQDTAAETRLQELKQAREGEEDEEQTSE